MSALPQVIQDPNQPGKFDYIFPSGGLLSVYSDSQADATQQVVVYLATLTTPVPTEAESLAQILVDAGVLTAQAVSNLALAADPAPANTATPAGA